MYRVIIETKSCTNCDDKREIYETFFVTTQFCTSPTLPMKLEVAVEAKAEASEQPH